MDPTVITALVPLGPSVVMMALLLFTDRERKKLADIVQEQIADKQEMRRQFDDYRSQMKSDQERQYLLLEKHAVALQQCVAALEQVQELLRRKSR